MKNIFAVPTEAIKEIYQLNDLEYRTCKDAREAFHDACFSDSGTPDSRLVAAQAMVLKAKEAMGSLTVKHPLYKELSIMDFHLQSLFADMHPSESAKVEKERIREFLNFQYQMNIPG